MTHSLSRCKNINYLKAVESQPPITSGPNQAKYVTGLNFTTFVSFLFIIYNNIFISTKPSFMFLKQNFGSNYSEKYTGKVGAYIEQVLNFKQFEIEFIVL